MNKFIANNLAMRSGEWHGPTVTRVDGLAFCVGLFLLILQVSHCVCSAQSKPTSSQSKVTSALVAPYLLDIPTTVSDGTVDITGYCPYNDDVKACITLYSLPEKNHVSFMQFACDKSGKFNTSLQLPEPGRYVLQVQLKDKANHLSPSRYATVSLDPSTRSLSFDLSLEGLDVKLDSTLPRNPQMLNLVTRHTQIQTFVEKFYPAFSVNGNPLSSLVDWYLEDKSIIPSALQVRLVGSTRVGNFRPIATNDGLLT